MKKVVIDKAYLDRALPPPPTDYEEEALAALRALAEHEEGTIVKRKLSVALVLGIALFLLLAGLALAAINWGSRAFITQTDQDGNARINEELAGIITPVDRVFESETLKVTVIDAAYDGASAVISWTVENKTKDQPVFLICDPTFNGVWDGIGHGKSISHMIIQPGEIITSALSTVLAEGEAADAPPACEIVLDIQALAVNGPIVPLAYDALTDDETIDKLIDEGNIVTDEDGSIWSGSLKHSEQYKGKGFISYLLELGRLSQMETLKAYVAIALHASERKGASDPMEIPYGDFTIRFVEAVRTPNTVTILLDAVFPDEATMKKHPIHPIAKLQSYGSHGMLYFKDGDGNDYFGEDHSSTFSFGTAEREPVRQPDGTWTWRVIASSMDFVYADDVCRIYMLAPLDEARTAYEERVMTITFADAGDTAKPE